MQIYVDWLLEQRKLVISVWILILTIAGSGLASLSISADNRVFYSSSNLEYIQLKEFESKYLPSNNIVLLITQKEQDTRSFPSNAISWTAERAWNVENVIRVDSLANYYTLTETADDELLLQSVLDAECLKASKCAVSDLPAIDKPALRGRLVGKSKESFAIILTLSLDVSNTSEIDEIMVSLGELKQDFTSAYPSLAIHHTGGIPMMAAFKEAAEIDSASLIPATLVTMLLVAWWALRSLKIATVLIGFGATSAVFALGLGGHLNLVLNTATAISSIVIITLVVATSMHFASSFINDAQIYARDIAAKNALAVNLKPIVLTTLTSVLGFLSMMLADAPPIGELGLISATGLLFGALQTLVIAPIIVNGILLESKIGPAQNVASFVARTKIYQKLWSPSLVLVLICMIGLGRLSINDDFVSYFGKDFGFRTQTDFVTQKLSGPNHIEVDLLARKQDGIFDKNYLLAARGITNWLRDQPIVSNVFSIDDVFRELEPIYERPLLESTADEIAQYYLAYELSLPYGQSTTDFVDQFRASSRISVLLESSNSNQIKSLVRQLKTFVSSEYAFEAIITGENVPVSNLTADNFRQMIGGIVSSLIAAAVLVGITLRSAKLAFSCLICTILPVLAGFGLWGWIFEDIGLAAVVIIAITMGIVVDDAIHLVSRFDQYRRGSSESISDIVQKTIRLTSGAIITTTIAMILGFCMLIFSGFGINQTLGICTVFVLSIAALVDLLILPKLLQTL